MLSDSERRRLNEIERDLRSEDPSFARRISTSGPRPSTRQWCGMGAAGWLLAGIVAACLAILLQSGGMAVVALIGFCASLTLWAGRPDAGQG